MSVATRTAYYQRFDLNDTNNQWVVKLGDAENVTVTAEKQSTWATAVLTLYRSLDGFNAYALESGVTLTGPASTAKIDCTGFDYLIIRLTTNEGSAVYANITVKMRPKTA